MKAVLNNKLYDTEVAQFLCGIELVNGIKLNVYKTKKGNIFAENKKDKCLIGENVLKSCLQFEHCIEAYVEVFGQPEEA